MSTAPEKQGKGMTFAEQQLQKHGWKQGKGLGKRENGISEAIKVKVKSDTAGVGHDAAEQFTFHWWDHLFNKAAANIAVEAGQDGIQVKKLSEENGEITHKKPRKALGIKNRLYGRFVKAATLTSAGEEPAKQASSSESSEDAEEKLDLSSATKLTDEELIRACGGRTAHKGARHGLNMSAKLARLEEQERAFLAKYRQEEEPRGATAAGQQEAAEGATPGSSLTKKRKKAKKKDQKSRERDAAGSPGVGLEEEERPRKRKRRRKQEEEGVEDETEPMDDPDQRERGKKKKKRKRQAE
uniref:G patch domain-containing protein 4 n=1 Tax=Sphenodon punctatus TaxID=8508 RepID=A0A8D0GBN7_SPHPU